MTSSLELGPDAAVVKDGQGGFTLLEALVSLVLLGLILGAFPSALRLGQRALSSAESWEQSSVDSAANAFLFRKISEAMPIREAREDGLQSSTFKGDARAVTFIAPLMAGPSASGVYRFTLAAVVSERDGESVQLTWQPYAPPGSARQMPVESRIVMRDGSPFRLRYWGRGTGRVATWHDQWIAAEVPEAVEITYALAGRGGNSTTVRRIALKLRG